MVIRLFDIQNSKVVLTEHCYALPFLKSIMEKYPDTHMQVYQYLFYMTCPNPDLNPFFNLPEHEKEDIIIEEIGLEESPEDGKIRYALDMCKKMYETPSLRAYTGIKHRVKLLLVCKNLFQVNYVYFRYLSKEDQYILLYEEGNSTGTDILATLERSFCC